MQKKSILKVLIGIVSILIVGCLSFLNGQKYQQGITNPIHYQPNNLIAATTKVNRSNVPLSDKTTKRVFLEAAHGAGFDGCNHASQYLNGTTYYENYEARIMIDKIAGYLNQAGVPYEIGNEIVGDAYFNSNTWDSSKCQTPHYGDCCGFKQSVIGNNSGKLYQHVDDVGSSNYLMAFELHFNGSGGIYSVVAVDQVTEEYEVNGKKLINAVDKVIGTQNSQVMTDVEMFGSHLGTISHFQRQRGIPTYYLETFFLDNVNHLGVYLNKKDELALEIATAIAEIAGSSGVISPGLLDDPFTEFPGLTDSNDFTCETIFLKKNKKGKVVETEFKKILDGIFTLIKILAPVIAIGLSILDYIKTIPAGASAIKNANTRTMKRVFIGVAIFFLPYLLDLLFHLFGLYDLSRCGIGG